LLKWSEAQPARTSNPAGHWPHRLASPDRRPDRSRPGAPWAQLGRPADRRGCRPSARAVGLAAVCRRAVKAEKPVRAAGRCGAGGVPAAARRGGLLQRHRLRR